MVCDDVTENGQIGFSEQTDRRKIVDDSKTIKIEKCVNDAGETGGEFTYPLLQFG